MLDACRQRVPVPWAAGAGQTCHRHGQLGFGVSRPAQFAEWPFRQFLNRGIMPQLP